MEQGISAGAPTLSKAERDFITHGEGVIPPVIVVQLLKQVNGTIAKSLDFECAPFAHSRTWTGCRHSLRISVNYCFREPSQTHTPPRRLGNRVHAPSRSRPHLFFNETLKCVKVAVGERGLTCAYMLVVVVVYECTAFLCFSCCK